MEVYKKLTSTSHSLTEIARKTNTSMPIIHNIMGHIELERPSSLPETLGIDEFLGSSGSYDPSRKRYLTEKYHCVVTDASAGVVVDILYKATFADLQTYFSKFPLFMRQKVKFFCTDMRPGFSKVARACFPQAKICIDPFHVVKNSQKLLTTSPYNENRFWNLEPERTSQKKKRVFALSPDLETVHDALMEFYDLRREPDFQLRRADLSDWLDKYLTCECPPLRKAAQSIRYHRKGIENAWRYKKSNSPTEGRVTAALAA